nr:AraC family transcriptional regulator [uncultured Eisenbergiella sp.]
MKYLNEIRQELDTLAQQGEKGIGYQPSSDIYTASYSGSYFDGIHLKKNSLPAGYIHENVQVEPDIQVRCFSYEDAGVLVPRHWHNSLEILYIARGDMEIMVNDLSFRLEADDFAIINSRDIHATSCSEHSQIHVLQIPYPFLKKHIPDFDNLRFLNGSCGNPASDEVFRFCLTEIRNIYMAKPHGYQLHFTSLLYELLFLCVSCFRAPEGAEASSMTDEERTRLITVMDYVNAHYHESISLGNAASLVALNPEYFCRFFKKNMGMTFLEFVNQVRFSHICEDIIRTDTSITDLLDRHGFTNYKLFRRLFHEKYGCTPSEKRKETSGK